MRSIFHSNLDRDHHRAHIIKAQERAKRKRKKAKEQMLQNTKSRLEQGPEDKYGAKNKTVNETNTLENIRESKVTRLKRDTLGSESTIGSNNTGMETVLYPTHRNSY